MSILGFVDHAPKTLWNNTIRYLILFQQASMLIHLGKHVSQDTPNAALNVMPPTLVHGFIPLLTLRGTWHTIVVIQAVTSYPRKTPSLHLQDQNIPEVDGTTPGKTQMLEAVEFFLST